MVEACSVTIILLALASSPAIYSRIEEFQGGNDDTVQRVSQILLAVGGVDSPDPKLSSSALYIREETSDYYIRMYATGGQLSTFRRREDYFKEFVFSSDKPDKIQSVEQAEARMRQFMSASGLGWEEVLYFNVRRVQEVDSRNYTNYEDQRRVYDAILRERSEDPRRGFRTLRTGHIAIDAQHGNVLVAGSTYLPPAGPWRLTISEASARQAAMAEWSNQGLKFQAEQVTLQPKWIRTNTLFNYQPDEVLIAGWSVEARRNPTDKEWAALIWVHGESGKIVYSTAPFRSTGE